MKFTPLTDDERDALTKALNRNAEDGVPIYMDPKKTTFRMDQSDPHDEEVIAAIRSVPCHYGKTTVTRRRYEVMVNCAAILGWCAKAKAIETNTVSDAVRESGAEDFSNWFEQRFRANKAAGGSDYVLLRDARHRGLEILDG